MNCRDWEERLALYVGGDLRTAEKGEVERHLRDCSGCQVFLSGLKEGLQVLRDAHAEQPAPAHFAAVRARVLAELTRERTPWWTRWWAFAPAVAAVVALMVVWMWPVRRPVPLPPQVARVAPAPDLPSRLAPARISPTRKRAANAPHRLRRARREMPTPVTGPAKPLVVKLVTDDPDVVIYWITETRGE